MFTSIHRKIIILRCSNGKYKNENDHNKTPIICIRLYINNLNFYHYIKCSNRKCKTENYYNETPIICICISINDLNFFCMNQHYYHVMPIIVVNQSRCHKFGNHTSIERSRSESQIHYSPLLLHLRIEEVWPSL